MIAFTISGEQLRAAPPEVRRWIEREIAATLASSSPDRRTEPAAPEIDLTACTYQEASALYEAIRRNAHVAQVFFELSRGAAVAGSPICRLSIADMMQHTRLDLPRLMEALGVVEHLFRQLRGDASTSLLATDGDSHIFARHETCEHIKTLWDHFASVESSPAPPLTRAEQFPGFRLPGDRRPAGAVSYPRPADLGN